MSEVDTLCDKQALTMVHWPGRDPLPMCADHHAWIVQVAGAIGLYVSTTATEPGTTCTQHVTKKEQRDE